MAPPPPSDAYKKPIIRSSSHSDLASAPASNGRLCSAGSRDLSKESTMSNTPELTSADNLAMSWPPPGFLMGSKSGQPEGATRGGCFIPGPEEDDYGRRLKSRMAVQRLAPTGADRLYMICWGWCPSNVN